MAYAFKTGKTQWFLGRGLLLALTVQLFVFTAFAGPVEDLLALDHQPTLAEMKAAFGGALPEQNPFGAANSALKARVLEGAPAVIAAFEKAFPGATFAPLGRDTVFLGDILDAFYRSLGQNGRVVRVSASGASRTNEADLVDFIKGLGFDLAKMNESPPFIVFDQTRFKEGSQSTTYLKAVYSACLTIPECKPADLIQKFNFINTGPLMNHFYNLNVITPDFNVNEFFASLAYHREGPPPQLLSVAVPLSLTYTSEYHDTFGKFTRLSDNSVTTRAGGMSADSVRLEILANVYDAAQVAATPDFLRAVEKAARDLGYVFPRERVTDPKQVARIRGQAVGVKARFARVIEAPETERDAALARALAGLDLVSGKELRTELMELLVKSPELRSVWLRNLGSLSDPSYLRSIQPPIVKDYLARSFARAYLELALVAAADPKTAGSSTDLAEISYRVQSYLPASPISHRHHQSDSASALNSWWLNAMGAASADARPRMRLMFLDAVIDGIKRGKLLMTDASTLMPFVFCGWFLTDVERAEIRKRYEADKVFQTIWSSSQKSLTSTDLVDGAQIDSINRILPNRCMRALRKAFLGK